MRIHPAIVLLALIIGLLQASALAAVLLGLATVASVAIQILLVLGALGWVVGTILFTSFYLDGAYRAGVSVVTRTYTGVLVICFWPVIAVLLLISRVFQNTSVPR